MMRGDPYNYKIADQEWEMEAIHRLNGATFAGEMLRDEAPLDGRLVDRFHETNVYVICVRERELLGMVAVGFERPFSFDEMVADLDERLPEGHSWCEIRLLAMAPERRGGAMLAGLVGGVLEVMAARGRDAAVIFAPTRQLKLCEHLGFVPCGPAVGKEGALCQPMQLDVARFHRLRVASGVGYARASEVDGDAVLSFLPGPVTPSAAVRAAFEMGAISHRSEEFRDMVEEIQLQLHSLTSANYVSLLAGGGTLANDAVAAQLKQLGTPGLVVSCGEYGERLADHARRWQLPHEHLALPFGMAPEAHRVAALLDKRPAVEWLWMTHCEMSNGAMMDLDVFTHLCHSRGLRLALDCTSSIGVVPVNLNDVWMASATSGKGLGAVTGVALVLHRQAFGPTLAGVPRCMDVGLCAESHGVPFTLSSHLVRALRCALQETCREGKWHRIERLGNAVRRGMTELGMRPVGPASGSPAVLTYHIPERFSAREFADLMEAHGLWLNTRSRHLAAKRHFQICLMGEQSADHVAELLRRLERLFPQAPEKSLELV